MRISPDDIAAIIDIFSQTLQGGQARLYLYGSRVDDALKGGDIDLALHISEPSLRADIQERKYRILALLKQSIGDQKIDLSIIGDEQLSEPFYVDSLKQSCLLKHWS